MPAIEVVLDNFVPLSPARCLFGAVLFSASPKATSSHVYMENKKCSAPVEAWEAERRAVKIGSARKNLTILIEGLIPNDDVRGGVILDIWQVPHEREPVPGGLYVAATLEIHTIQTIRIPDPFPLPPTAGHGAAETRSRLLGYHDSCWYVLEK